MATRERGASMPEAIDHLIAVAERRKFALATRAAHARLRRDPEAWADYRADVADLDGTRGAPGRACRICSGGRRQRVGSAGVRARRRPTGATAAGPRPRKGFGA